MSISKDSKFLSYTLRHSPSAIDLTLDKNGWVPIEELLSACARHGRKLTLEQLMRIVTDNDKLRFVISQDGLRIRASHGHSVAVDLALPESVPPEILFHGTAKRTLAAILTEGIRPGKRIYVHLSPDEETAVEVGKRHGPPVVLRVRAGEMQRDGFRFLISGSGIWLTQWVPAEYLVAGRTK